MAILFPHNPIDPKQADEPFQLEYQLLKELNVKCSLFDFDLLAPGESKPKPALSAEEPILYRGWMLNPSSYNNFAKLVRRKGAELITSEEKYILSHHLPNWYESLEDLTPESIFFPADVDIEKEADKLNWESYFDHSLI